MLWGDYLGLGDDTSLTYPDPSEVLQSGSLYDPSLTSTGVFGSPDTYPTEGTFGPAALPSTLVADALSPGYMNPDYVPPANTVGVPQLATSAIAAAGQALAPGPSPRVNVPLTTASVGQFATGSTLIAGVPNLAIIAGVGLLAVVLLGGGKRRR